MSKSSLPRLDLFLRPFLGGDSEGNEGGEGGQGEGKPGGEGENQPAGKGDKPEDDDDDDDDHDDDDLSGIADPRDRQIAALSREAARHRREKNKNKRDAERIQRELDALKNGKGTEKEQWEAEKKSFEQKYEDLLTNTSNTVLRNAVKDPETKYSWYDVPVVMGLINRDAIEIDLEEGVVDGLEAELKRIAKEKPYLVKKGSTGGGNSGSGNNSSGGAGAAGSTGSNPSGRNSSNDARAAQRATLESKYPGLNV